MRQCGPLPQWSGGRPPELFGSSVQTLCRTAAIRLDWEEVRDPPRLAGKPVVPLGWPVFFSALAAGTARRRSQGPSGCNAGLNHRLGLSLSSSVEGREAGSNDEDEEPEDVYVDGSSEETEEDLLARLLAGAAGDEEDILGDGTLVKSIISPAPKFTRRPQLGDEVTVHFVGTLEDGKVFDDSRKRGEPYRFNVGLEQVIKGFDKGIPTMMKGERALFTMAPEMAYGEAGAGWKIPPNETLRFDVELLGFEELDDMSSEFDEDDILSYEAEEGIGRMDRGPGGKDPAGRYRWERCGVEVLVTAPLEEDIVAQDIQGEFLPQRVHVAVRGKTLFSGRPGCDLDWEECTWNIDTDSRGRRYLLVHLQKMDALHSRWPSSLLLEEEGEGEEEEEEEHEECRR